jgi:hypothetical protein
VVDWFAAGLASPGLAVSVPSGSTRSFSAIATDAADNASACSNPISYTQQDPPPSPSGSGTVRVLIPPELVQEPSPTGCLVPKVAGLPLPRAKSSLARSGCATGKVTKPKRGGKKGLVVKRTSPAAGQLAADRLVSLFLGPKPHRRHH